ncbi:hypothetical protein ABIB26_003688 [Arthrobacter sp. UYEF20]
MVVLMYAGMFVLDPLYDLVAGLAGVSDPWGRLPVLSNVVMALNMTVPMALYMRHKRHSWRAICEMTAAPARHTLPTRVRQLQLRGRIMDSPHMPGKKRTLTAGGTNCLVLDKRMVL